MRLMRPFKNKFSVYKNLAFEHAVSTIRCTLLLPMCYDLFCTARLALTIYLIPESNDALYPAISGRTFSRQPTPGV